MFKKKSHKIAAFFKNWRNFGTAGEISAQTAVNMQKKYVSENETASKSSCTPPYLQIVPFLFSEQQQVFEAAVFYLCKIYTLNSASQSEIADVFSVFIHSSENLPERISYIKEKCRENHIL